jgi:DNA-directed RNA polymerase specialized sigma24 family protein
MKPKAEATERLRPSASAPVAHAALCEGCSEPSTDASPFDAVYDEYAPLLRKIANLKFGISSNDAADLVHDIFCHVSDKSGTCSRSAAAHAAWAQAALSKIVASAV